MADNTIDTLDIQINSSTRNATKALSNLAKKLKDVDTALGNVNTGGLRNYAREIGRVSAALQALNKTKVSVPNLAGLTGQLRSLSKVDFTTLGASTKSLQNLAAGLSSLKGVSNISIPKIDTKNVKSAVNAIQKFQEIDATKMQPAITGVEKIASTMNALNGMNFKDSKITNVINSLSRLASADMSGFDTSKMGEIIKSIDSLNDIRDVSSSVNRFTGSLARLANAGGKADQSAEGLKKLGKSLRKVINGMLFTAKPSESINMFVQSISRLANAGDKTGKTASQLENLAAEVKKFFTSMQDAPRISENTLRMTEALGQLAAASGKVGTSTNTVVNSFNKLSSIGSGLSSLLGGVATKAKSGLGFLAAGISSLVNRSSGLKTASSNVGSFIKTVLGFKAASAVMNKFSEAMGGKGILEIGSDIAEVENVVDVAFGSMADQAYKFASTATKQFGLSELAAKNYSGTMMAMLNASGVAQESAAKMSTTLAGLAGDLASFYNIDTDTAFYKIRAGISGEIEPLKQLGINLSVANLQEYALSQGITTAYNSMTQAQKTMLRYNYIMSVTSAQQGDFARTAGSWANQVRLLTLNIQSLASVIGQGLIAAVLPGIQALNALMSKLMQAAETFRNFMYVLMGKKIKGSTSGVVNDLAGLEDSAADLSGLQDAGDAAASGLDDATSSAKTLKKALSVLPFDELNQLTDNSSSSGSTPGTGTGKTGTGTTPSLGLGGITDQIDDALNKEETPINKWAEKIRKAFLNHDWEGLGKTIADMLNIGIRKIYDVISWSNVGPKISAFCDAFTRSFNSLVENIHWDRLGRTVGAGINTLVNTFELLIGPGGIDFVNIGNKLATGLRGMIDEVNWPNLGQVLGSGFMISWNILDGFVQKMSKENNAGLTGWEQLGTAVSDAMNGAFGRISFSKIATTIATGLNGAFQTLATWTQKFNWGELVNNISNGINTFIGKFKWQENGTSLNTFITNLLNALVDIAEKTDWESFGRGIGLFLSQIDWGSHLKDLATVLLDVLGGIFSGLGETTAGKFVVAFAGVGLVSKADTLVSSILVAMGKLPTGTSATATLLGTALSKIATAFSTSTLGTAVGVYALEAVDKLKAIPTTITTQIAPKILEVITTKLWPAATAFAGSIGTWITGTFAPAMATAFSTLGSVLFSPIGLAVIGAVVGGFLLWQNWDTVTEFAGKAKEAIENAFSTAGTWLYTHGSNLINGLYNGAKNVISTVGTWLKTNISDPIINGVKNLFGIHSPSTVFAEIGGYLISGLNQGISDRIGSVIDTFTNIKNTVTGVWDAISSNTKTAWDSIGSKIKGAWDTITGQTETNSASAATSAEKSFSRVSTSATKNWGNSSREVTKNVRQMKVDASTELGRMDETVRSHFGSQYRIALGKWQNLGRDISSYIRGTMDTSIGGAINGIVTTISRNFGDMYSIGQTAMQNLRNGMESINIRTPHISMDYTDWQEGQTHKWRYNSRVDWYAKGGLFNAASVIGVGEAGKEAVLPLTNKQAMKSIADSITGNMPDGSIGLGKEEMTQAVTQGVAMAMMNMNTGGSSSPQYISNTINLDGRAIAKAVTKAQNDNNRRKNPSPAW
nr:MAG TPA: minor tail protein [Caudoviricetes sp.]